MADATSFERSGFTMSSIRPFTFAISAAALVLLSACGGNTSTPSAGGSPSTTTSSPSVSTAPAPTATGPATVKVSTTTLGEVLTDSRGFALYKFDPDVGGISVCYEVNDCATKWPALLTAGPPKAEAGTNAAMLDTAPRRDGAMQVRYNKMPLYHYAKDTAPGQINGQGVLGIWWLVAPDGTVIKKTAATPTS